MRKPALSFGILADLQYCEDLPYKDRHFRNSLSKLDHCINTFNKENLQFIIDLGDLIDNDFTNFNTVLKKFKEFTSPTYFTLGNHDYAVDDSLKSQVIDKIGLSGNGYYQFSFGNWDFIVLNGNEISTYANLPGTNNYHTAEKILFDLEKKQAINAHPYDGAISKQQMIWLQEKLEHSQNEKKNVVIFCHFPVFPVNKHNLLNDTDVLSLITQYDCVKIWFNGHNHDGNYGLLKNIHFLNVKGMVETENEVAFSMIHLYEDKIILKGYGRESDRELLLTPSK